MKFSLGGQVYTHKAFAVSAGSGAQRLPDRSAEPDPERSWPDATRRTFTASPYRFKLGAGKSLRGPNRAMRILILGHREIASNLGISLLVQGLKQHDLRIALSGSGEAHAVSTPAAMLELDRLEQALCDQLEAGSPGPSAARAGVYGFRALAEQTGKPIGMLPAPNSPAGLETLAGWAPELIMSLRYRKILHEQAIALPPLGVLNLHSGLLPKFRGVMATFHALLEGSDQIGSTVHRISGRGIDTGDIVQCMPIPARPERGYLANVLSLYPSGCAAMIQAVNTLDSGNALKTWKQPESDSYYRAPGADLCQRYFERGLRLHTGTELPDFLAG
jgi:methionyl-tRNA formyltransferase